MHVFYSQKYFTCTAPDAPVLAARAHNTHPAHGSHTQANLGAQTHSSTCTRDMVITTRNERAAILADPEIEREIERERERERY